METRKRTIVKTLTFRIIATVATVVLVLLFTKNWALAGVVGAFDCILKIIIYYGHERTWNKISWGRS